MVLKMVTLVFLLWTCGSFIKITKQRASFLAKKDLLSISKNAQQVSHIICIIRNLYLQNGLRYYNIGKNFILKALYWQYTYEKKKKQTRYTFKFFKFLSKKIKLTIEIDPNKFLDSRSILKENASRKLNIKDFLEIQT